MTNTHIFTFTVHQLQYSSETLQTHIYLHLLCINYNIRVKHYKHTYIYIYCASTTIFEWNITNTRIFTFTVHQLQYSSETLQTHIYLNLLWINMQYSSETLKFSADIPRAIWISQHLTDTVEFKGHWSHDLHDLISLGSTNSLGARDVFCTP